MESKRFGDIEYKASGGKLHWVRDMMCNTRVVMDDDEFIALALCNPAVKALADAARALVDYRKRAGALNFQLEKADDYIRRIEAALAALEGRDNNDPR